MDAETKRIVDIHRQVLKDHPTKPTEFQLGCTADRLYLIHRMSVSDDEIIAAMEEAQN
jgi:hypothetical protein